MVGGQRMMRGAGQRKTMNEEEKILNRNSVNTGTVTMRQNRKRPLHRKPSTLKKPIERLPRPPPKFFILLFY